MSAIDRYGSTRVENSQRLVWPPGDEARVLVHSHRDVTVRVDFEGVQW